MAAAAMTTWIGNGPRPVNDGPRSASRRVLARPVPAPPRYPACHPPASPRSVQGHPMVDDPVVVCDRVFRLAVPADGCLGLHGPCPMVPRLLGLRAFPAVDSLLGMLPRPVWVRWAGPGGGGAA